MQDASQTNRAELLKKTPQIIWCYGYSAAGKSTLARCLYLLLREWGVAVTLLDGDNLRKALCSDLGFSLQDRTENIRRVAEAAVLLANAGVSSIVACITPREADRTLARNIVGPKRFFDIFVDTPLAVCKQRDPKGLYKKALAGELSNFTGVDSPFESPCAPALRLASSSNNPEHMAMQALDKLANKLIREGI